jgi:integrase
MTSKKPRRARGEGSIYQRKDGRFVASLPVEGPGRARKYFYGKTRAEVRAKLQQAQLEQKQGLLATGPRQTVQQFLEHWLENVHKPHIRANSYRIYRQLFDNYILPALGSYQLQKLSPQHIDELYARKLSEGYAAETVRSIHRVLHRALEDAVKWGLVSVNVCDKVNQPRAVKFETHPLTGEQARQLLEVARGSDIEVMLKLALTTGMRIGELVGLRWADIDFQEVSLQIRHTVSRIGRRGIVENDPKTESSKRKIMLPRFVLDALQQHREHQAGLQSKAGAAWQEKDVVFSNRYGGFLERSNIVRRFKELLKEAGLPAMRFHDLRHSAATILLKMGIHPKQVQELLGHSSFKITMDRYSHILPSMQREMMEKIDNFFTE